MHGYCGPAWFYHSCYRISLDGNTIAGDRFVISPTFEGSAEEIVVSGNTKTKIWSSVIMDFNALSVGSSVYSLRLTRTDTGKSDDIKVEDNLILNSIT